MAYGITEQDVFRAADALLADGTRPTQTAVREFLDGGSFATIGPALKKWRMQQQEQHELADVAIPDDLAAALQSMGGRVWSVAIEAAEARLSSERDALAAAREELEAEAAEHAAAVEQLEQEAEEREGVIRELVQEKTEAREERQDLQRQVAELQAALTAAQAATAAEVAKVEAVYAERVEGLQARLQDALHTIERLTDRPETEG